MGVVVVTVLVLAAAFALVWAMTSDRYCPESSDGRHEWVHKRGADGWALECVACLRITTGITAFKREA